MRQGMLCWRDYCLWKEHVNRIIPMIQAVVLSGLASRAFSAWLRHHHLARRALVLRRRVTEQRGGRSLRLWRRAAALMRLPAVRARAAERLLQEHVRQCFHRLSSVHRSLQDSLSDLAARRPGLLMDFGELVGRRVEERRSALVDWYAWVRRRRREAAQDTAVKALRRERRLGSAFCLWDQRRRRRASKAARSALAEAFWRSDVGGLRLSALRSWAGHVAAVRRARHTEELADTSRRRKLLRSAWSRWHRLAHRAVACRTLEQALVDAGVASWRLQVLHGWNDWCCRSKSLRLTAQGLSAAAAQRYAAEALLQWRAESMRQAASTVHRRAQVEERRRRVRRQIEAAFFGAWHAFVAEAQLAAASARQRRAFACWRLVAQEQRLLHRYLSECSASGFPGAFGTASRGDGGTVQPADFERVYAQLAAQRWEDDGDE